MRKHSPSFLAAMLALTAITAAGVRAEDPAAVRREIEAGYARISAAFKRQDAAAMLALATPDFQVRTPTGRTLNREAARQNLQNNLDTIRAIRENRYHVHKVTVQSNGAVVHVTERYAVSFLDSRGEFGAVGKTHEVAGTTTYRDTWVKQDGGGAWRLRRSEILGMKLTLDGRPYRPTTTRPRKEPSR